MFHNNFPQRSKMHAKVERMAFTCYNFMNVTKLHKLNDHNKDIQNKRKVLENFAR